LLEIDPGDARVHAIRADLLARMGRPAEAIEAAGRALEFNPTLLTVREWLAGVLQKAGRGEQQREQEQIMRRMKTARPPQR
jgi:predicted Zn-dependent protease